jgi:plasmid stability protein
MKATTHQFDSRNKLCYCETVKNITISIEDELYRRARIRAAEESTSVSAMVREFLIEVVHGSKGGDKFDRLLQEQKTLLASIHQKHPRLSSNDNLSRDELHDRHAIS